MALRQYFWALTAHFGYRIMLPRKRKPTWIVDAWLRYGQLKKMRRGRKLHYIQTEVLCGSRQAIRQTLEALGFSSIINTSFIERLNLTLRQMIAPLTRRTWSLAKSNEYLLVHVHRWRTYYPDERPCQGFCMKLIGESRSRQAQTAFPGNKHPAESGIVPGGGKRFIRPLKRTSLID
jgi:hypothetical protein